MNSVSSEGLRDPNQAQIRSEWVSSGAHEQRKWEHKMDENERWEIENSVHFIGWFLEKRTFFIILLFYLSCSLFSPSSSAITPFCYSSFTVLDKHGEQG